MKRVSQSGLRLLALLAIFMIGSGISSRNILSGQSKTDSAANGTSSRDEIEMARQAFQGAVADWKVAAKDALRAMRKFSLCQREDAEKWREEWRQAIERGNQARDLAAARGLDYFKLAEGMADGNQALALVLRMVQFDIESGRFNRAWQICNELEQFRPGNPQILAQLGVLSIKTNRFENAAVIAKKLMATPRREEFEKYYEGLDLILEDWEKEKKLREAEKGKMPRVKIVTTQGSIELELFENEAPETVANFISLVRSGFYNNLKFHRVIAGFMAQTGCPNGDGSGDAGYSIYDEHNRADARKHYRGVISMANMSKPNTGGSQFFLTIAPQPMLDNKHAVFGRIVKGDEVLERLKLTHEYDDEKKEVPIDGVVPDEIISAEVLDDSGKEYKPRKVSNQ